MNIYSGRLHDDLQLFPEWELVVAYFHHIFDEVVNSEACQSHQYPHPLPTICTPCIISTGRMVIVAKKNPY